MKTNLQIKKANRTLCRAISFFLLGGVLIVVFVECVSAIKGIDWTFNDLFAGFAFVTTLTLLFTQSSIMIQQQSENTLFQMIRQLREIADNIEFGQNWYRGKNVFKDFYNRLKQYRLNAKGKSRNKIIQDFTNEKDYILFENYYNYLFQTLLFIDRMPLISSSEKRNYAEILKSHLSTYELMMLFYHICVFDSDELKKLINKYRILEFIKAEEWSIFEDDKEDLDKFKTDNRLSNH